MDHQTAYDMICEVDPRIAGDLWDVPAVGITGCDTANMLTYVIERRVKKTTLRRIVERLAKGAKTCKGAKRRTQSLA